MVWILSTCVLVLVCLALRQLLRGKVDPRLTYGLWLLVALRVLIPFSPIPSPVSVDGALKGSGLAQAVTEFRYSPVVVPSEGSNPSKQSPEEYAEELEQADWFQSSMQSSHDSIAPVRIISAAEIPPEEFGPGHVAGQSYIRMEVMTFPDHFAVLYRLWLAGMAVMAAVFLTTNLRFHRRLRRCRQPYGGEPRLPCSIPVYVAPFLPSPCLFGLWKPAIYLNPAALESDHLNHILIHELTHYRHRDHLWAALRSLCLVVQWFNPLVWLAAHLSKRDCELACDASAIRELGEAQRLSYGKTLVDMIARGRAPGQLLHTATTMTAGKNGLKERVTLIARGHRMTALTLAAVLLVSAIAAGCSFASVPAQSDAAALEFADQFDSYNAPGNARHFHLSQGELDGQPCYLFRNEEHGVSIRVVRREEVKDWLAQLRLDSGEELAFEMPVFPLGYGSVSGVADFYLGDLTGDGAPELAYLHGGRGTGFANDRAQVFDLAAMASIPVSWDNEALADDVTVRPVARWADYSESPSERSWEEAPNDIVYEFTAAGGQQCYGRAPTEDQEMLSGVFPQQVAAVFGDYEIIIWQEDGTLGLHTSFTTEHTPFGAYVGVLSAPFVYDAAANTLTPGPYTLSPLTSTEASTPIPDPDGEALDYVLAVYQAIVRDNASAWRLEVDHPQEGLFRCEMDSRTGYLALSQKDDLPYYFDWQYADGRTAPSGAAQLILSRNDPLASAAIRVFEGSDLVEVTYEGETHWLSAPRRQENGYSSVYDCLLTVASHAATANVWSSVRVDGSITDHEQAAALAAEQIAANFRSLPSWTSMDNEDVRVNAASVFDAYHGEDENFCAGLGFYVKVEDERTAGDWQAGAGLTRKGTGDFSDYWHWGVEADFCRDANGDWMCTGWGSGGGSVRLPVTREALETVPLSQLAEYFTQTSGFTHEWILPSTLVSRAAGEPDGFVAALTAMSGRDRAELLYHMGYAAILDRAQYQALRELLPEEWRWELAVAVFERDGLALAVHGVQAVRTETGIEHGEYPYEYTVFVCGANATAYVWEAGLSDPSVAADGQAHPQFGYILAPLGERDRIAEALTLRELTPDVEGVAHLEASLYVLKFEYPDDGFSSIVPDGHGARYLALVIDQAKEEISIEP